MTVLVKISFIHAHILASAFWARRFVSAARPGWQRLALAAPIVIANAFAPLVFDPEEEFTLYACNLLLLVWLANFKIVALALNRGSLSYDDLSTSQFVLLYMLPITAQSSVNYSHGAGNLEVPAFERSLETSEEDARPGTSKIPRVKSNSRFDQSAGSNIQLAIKWTAKLVSLLVIVFLLTRKADWMPVLLIELAEAFMLYWFLGVLMDGPAALIGWLTAMPISPHFDAPYLSLSMSEFWSKRWNLTVGNTLRALCYDPLHEGRLVGSKSGYKVNRLRSAAAVCWTFTVSGLMHELLIWYIDPHAATGEWLLYFVLQGPLLLLEASMKRLCRQRGFKLPRPVSIGLTLTTQLLLAHCFFFPPAVRNHLDTRFFNDVGKNFNRLSGIEVKF